MILSLVISILVFVLTIFGNVLTIFVTINNKQMRFLRHYLVANLAVADLFVALLAFPLRLVGLFGSPWINNCDNCLITITFTLLFCNTSVLSLTLMTFDRYRCIVHPYSYSDFPTFKNFWIPVLLCWVLSTLVSFLPYIGWKKYDLIYMETVNICRYLSVLDEHYIIFVFVATVFIPFLLMVMSYIRIFLVAKKQSTKISKSTVQTNASTRKNDTPSIANIVRSYSVVEKARMVIKEQGIPFNET